MKVISILSFLLMLISIPLTAQEENTKKKVHLVGFSARIGTFTNSPDVGEPISSFQKLAPNSRLAFSNLDGFRQNRFTVTSVNAPTIAMNAHLMKSNKEERARKFNSEFTIGLSYTAIELLTSSYSREETIRVDTLQSTRTGEDIFIDSIVNEFFNYRYQQDLLYLNIGASISTDFLNRWKFSVGAETSIGYVLKAKTFLSRSQYSRFESSNNDFVRESFNDELEFEVEEVNNESGISTRVTLPAVLSFRLSKEADRRLSQCMLALESRPSFAFYNIPELDSDFYFTYNWSVGIRYDL